MILLPYYVPLMDEIVPSIMHGIPVNTNVFILLAPFKKVPELLTRQKINTHLNITKFLVV